MYSYLSPQEVWYGREKLIGKSAAYAHWVQWGDTREQNPEWYKFRFRVLEKVLIGPHAYTMVFTNGLREELISYDTVCVYHVELEKA